MAIKYEGMGTGWEVADAALASRFQAGEKNSETHLLVLVHDSVFADLFAVVGGPVRGRGDADGGEESG